MTQIVATTTINTGSMLFSNVFEFQTFVNNFEPLQKFSLETQKLIPPNTFVLTQIEPNVFTSVRTLTPEMHAFFEDNTDSKGVTDLIGSLQWTLTRSIA